MKKPIALFMSLLLVFGLVSCSSTPSANNISQTTPQSQLTSQISTAPQSQLTGQTSTNPASQLTSQTPNTPSGNSSTAEPPGSSEPASGAGSKILVVYYSASGNTESAANYIAAATGGDLLELVPKEDYTDADLNYRNADSRVVYEHDHPEAREIELVKSTVDNWDEYGTVFIGYPIWWQIAAWPVDGFIKANDFTGKTVIPFCTSASSGLGDSGKLLEEMAGSGNWLEGQRFSSGVSEQTVKDWVEGLNLAK